MEKLARPEAARLPGRPHLLDTVKENHVAITASVCLVVLVAAMKNVLMVPQDILLRDTMIYIIVYLGFLTMSFRTDATREETGAVAPFLWDALIVVITLAIIAVYAL